METFLWPSSARSVPPISRVCCCSTPVPVRAFFSSLSFFLFVCYWQTFCAFSGTSSMECIHHPCSFNHPVLIFFLVSFHHRQQARYGGAGHHCQRGGSLQRRLPRLFPHRAGMYIFLLCSFSLCILRRVVYSISFCTTISRFVVFLSTFWSLFLFLFLFLVLFVLRWRRRFSCWLMRTGSLRLLSWPEPTCPVRSPGKHVLFFYFFSS